MQQTRRSVIKAGAAAALPAAFGGALLKPGRALAAWNKGAFEAKSALDAMRALGVANAEDSKAIEIRAPEIAENGAVVPITVNVESPMTPANHVKHIYVIADKNRIPFITRVTLGPEAGRAFMGANIRLGETGDVRAIVEQSDGSLLQVKREVKVTVGGCGG